MTERGGGGAAWSIYRDSGGVGVVLSNCDGAPLLDICLREAEAVTGRSRSVDRGSPADRW